MCVCVCVCVVGDTDGLIKGKRYFTCPAKHGKMIRITNVIAVLPTKVSHDHSTRTRGASKAHKLTPRNNPVSECNFCSVWSKLNFFVSSFTGASNARFDGMV